MACLSPGNVADPKRIPWRAQGDVFVCIYHSHSLGHQGPGECLRGDDKENGEGHFIGKCSDRTGGMASNCERVGLD